MSIIFLANTYVKRNCCGNCSVCLGRIYLEIPSYYRKRISVSVIAQKIGGNTNFTQLSVILINSTTFSRRFLGVKLKLRAIFFNSI